MTRLLIGALLCSVAATALAADIPYRANNSYVAPVYVPPAFSWTGVYFGLNSGFAWAGTSDSSFGSPTGGALGATVGFNYQMGQIVLGVEGDWDWANLSNTQNLPYRSNSLDINETLTARARVGYAMNRALFFVTGGFGAVSTTASFTTPFYGWGGSQNQWVSGGAIGAGVEYAFTDHFTAKAEYLYLPLSDATYFNTPWYSTRAPVDLSLLRAGVNYKF